MKKVMVLISAFLASVYAVAHNTNPLLNSQFANGVMESGVPAGTDARYATIFWFARQAVHVNTDVSMSFSTPANFNDEIWYFADDYGQTGWQGLAQRFNVANGIHTDCFARGNQFYLDDEGDDHISGSTIHEIGHCLGLAHDANQAEMMWGGGTRCGEPGFGCGTTPDYVHTVNHLY